MLDWEATLKPRLPFGVVLAVAVAVAGTIATGSAAVGDPVPVVPVPTPTSSPKPIRVPTPVSNHTLSRENCGAPRGRRAWWQGSLQCHVMDGGAIVAIHAGKARRSYTGTPTDREIAYVDANWYTQGASGYTYLPNEDCANFVSQALRARGWALTKSWHPGSVDWISSTHLRGWILRQQSAVELKGVASFPQVKVGDIAQFDWHNKHIRNHTAIVTKVAQLADGSWEVWVGEHTDPYEYRDVRTMITKTHPGASVYFLSLP